MASDDPVTFQFHSSLQDDENFENDDIHDHHHHDDPHPHHNLSRLSVCTNSTMCGVDDDDDDEYDDGMAMYMSGLSIETSLEGDGGDDADGEFSDDDRGELSDSENEFPLPASNPPRSRRNIHQTVPIAVKESCGSSDHKEGVLMRQETEEKDTWVWDNIDNSEKTRNRNRNRRKKKEEEHMDMVNKVRSSRGRGGSSRSLCMDLEEVKGCRDLGFDLELEIPSRLSLSLSNSAPDTSSGATSPISNWRISSPGMLCFTLFCITYYTRQDKLWINAIDAPQLLLQYDFRDSINHDVVVAIAIVDLDLKPWTTLYSVNTQHYCGCFKIVISINSIQLFQEYVTLCTKHLHCGASNLFCLEIS